MPDKGGILGRNSLSAALSAVFVLISAGAARADTVTLECNSRGELHGEHDLYALDYAASTVHSYVLTDDGVIDARWSNETYPIQVADNVITWTEPLAFGSADITLGRYTGTLTIHSVVTGSSSGKTYDSTNAFSCHAWTPPQRQRQF